MNRKNIIMAALAAICAVLIVTVIVRKINYDTHEMTEEEIAEIEQEQLLFGLPIDRYTMYEEVIKQGESLSVLLGKYGISARTVDSLVRVCDGVFDLRTIRGGNQYRAFVAESDSCRTLCHFVYEKNAIDYVVFSFEDSLAVRTDSREVYRMNRSGEGTITSSLWNAMVEAGMSPALAMDLSDIYGWSIDFFGIQKGDKFKVIYDELFVDTISVGVGTIWGAWFEHNGKPYYAIPFEQDGKIKYWDENGNSLRKAFLKAPLSYSRISSKFSNSRLHPILKIRRPHHGVDYAAPAGTPVYAVADGTVTQRAYTNGGGNTVKIKHSQGIVTSYLHLRGFAKGLAVGKRVSQGELIGYVGSTGLSTGPHLDYRVHKNGVPMDPLKIPSEPGEPIADQYKAHFASVKEAVVNVLDGTSEPDEIMAALNREVEQHKVDSLAFNAN